MPEIVMNRMRSLDLVHECCKIVLGCFHKKVIVVVHQAEKVQPDTSRLYSLFKPLDEMLAILIIVKYYPPLHTPRRNVINRPLKLYP